MDPDRRGEGEDEENGEPEMNVRKTKGKETPQRGKKVNETDLPVVHAEGTSGFSGKNFPYLDRSWVCDLCGHTASRC